mgnify:CR=1 FL=1
MQITILCVNYSDVLRPINPPSCALASSTSFPKLVFETTSFLRNCLPLEESNVVWVLLSCMDKVLKLAPDFDLLWRASRIDINGDAS